jgi:hypothetical protein
MLTTPTIAKIAKRSLRFKFFMKTLKYFFLLTFLFLFQHQSYSQKNENKISEKEWDKIIQLLTKENWADAEKLSLKYLGKFSEKDDSLAEPAILRYMYIRCVAARLGEKEYSKEDAVKKTEPFIGKSIITPPKEFFKKCLFNCFQLSDDKKNFSSCASNTSMTVIQIFETYIPADTNLVKNTDSLENKQLRLAAFIKEIKAGGFAMLRLEIIFDRAFIWEEE